VYLRALRAPPTRSCDIGFTRRVRDPSPLTAGQLYALTATATRALTWGLPAVACEVSHWRTLANCIPDAAIREDALKAITEQRTHIDGAALFAVLPRTRSPSLVRLLVAYEIIWDFLDNVNERTAGAGVANGLQLHRALIDALDPGRPLSNYYGRISWHNDGGYLNALVTACQVHCANLPSYGGVRRSIIFEAVRAQVCAINHELDPVGRDLALEAWAITEFPHGHEAHWFELTAAASTNLTIFALLALASEPTCADELVAQTSLAYFPWISILTAMLDSYVDQSDDVISGNHNYVAHYSTPEKAVERICSLIRRCLHEAGSLGGRHVVIACCMFAMYLTKNSAQAPGMGDTTERLIDAGGSLTRVLRPILRLWRTTYGLRSA
jgi:tetraprenyl-beta-curcumene synthase